jgi:photolyase PhrII
MTLPPHLAERTRALNAHATRTGGRYVLYWMHHSVRDHDNAALDVARHWALALDRPLLVYQGLGGAHRFNADRHHAFILEGARDVAAGLEALGIRHIVHLPTDPQSPSPLAALLDDAAVFVTEDFPAPPFPRWTQAWANRAPCLTLSVDASLIVPIRLATRRFDRAFAFRDAMKAAFRARATLPWPSIDAKPRPFADALPFTPVNWATVDLNSAIAACAIDHGIAPVADTRGGSRAGYARWALFKSSGGLARYAELRNDAAVVPPLGVSRLSAYLHHGQISALRIAREALAVRADKFIDELWVWRELAYHWCAWTDDPESLAALPPWAQQTLAEHARDRREVVAETNLARARSPSMLWNLMQQSLLRHGELHNNLRMTWGKALIEWRPTPQAALDTLIDLNHRYALDGSNPNSYGGLLWCLGLFDRPHPPAQKILGALRSRPITAHARRLDVAAYAERIERPVVRAKPRVAIIGAGISGIAAARTLVDHGLDVVVYDKGRAVGGRLSSKTREPPLADHGAPSFTVRDPRFRRALAPLLESGDAAPWAARCIAIDPNGQRPLPPHPRFVGVPTMANLVRALAEGLDVRTGIEIASIADGRLVDTFGEAIDQADWVLVSAPPAQAARLVASASALHTLASNAAMDPCWVALIEPAIAPPIDWDLAFVDAQGLRLVIRESSKPIRRGGAFVVHASVDWSREHLEAEPADVATTLTAALDRVLGGTLGPLASVRAHRWRYAQSAAPLGLGAAIDHEQRLGLCGDWLADGRVEGAYLSGVALAGRLLGVLIEAER